MDFFAQLPQEIITFFLSFLGVEELCNVEYVSKRFFYIIQNTPSLWKESCLKFCREQQMDSNRFELMVNETKRSWKWFAKCSSIQEDSTLLGWNKTDNCIEFGTFEGGHLHGWGIKLSANKLDFGEFVESQIRIGERISKNRYTGTFKNGEKEDYGKMQYHNNDTYHGQFKAGKLCGKGVFRWANAGQYMGDFHDGTLGGFGHVVWDDGFQFLDNWLEGNPVDQQSSIHPKVNQCIRDCICTLNISGPLGGYPQWIYRCRICKLEYCSVCWNHCHNQPTHRYSHEWVLRIKCKCGNQCKKRKKL